MGESERNPRRNRQRGVVNARRRPSTLSLALPLSPMYLTRRPSTSRKRAFPRGPRSPPLSQAAGRKRCRGGIREDADVGFFNLCRSLSLVLSFLAPAAQRLFSSRTERDEGEEKTSAYEKKENQRRLESKARKTKKRRRGKPLLPFDVVERQKKNGLSSRPRFFSSLSEKETLSRFSTFFLSRSLPLFSLSSFSLFLSFAHTLSRAASTPGVSTQTCSLRRREEKRERASGRAERKGRRERKMELDNVAAGAAAAATTSAAPAALSRRVPLCSYSPPSLAGAPTASLRRGMTPLDSAAEKLDDWGSGFGGWLVSKNDEEEEEEERRRRSSSAAAATSSSSSSCDLFPFAPTMPLPTAQRQSTHELAGKGLKSAVAARDAAFYAEYSLFLSEAKGKERGSLSATATATAAPATSSSSALLTRESVVAGRRVPLAKLFRVVQRLGGYARVAEGKRAWRDVLRALEVKREVFFFRKGEGEKKNR